MHQLLSPDCINAASTEGFKSTRKTEEDVPGSCAAAHSACPLGVLPSDFEAAPPLAEVGREAARPWPTSSAPAKPAWPFSPRLLRRMLLGPASCCLS